MQFGIPCGEMYGEPVFQVGRKFTLEFFVGAVVVIVHNVADIVEQLIMIGFVADIILVVFLAHYSFFKGKMGRYARIDIAEEI